MEAYDNIIIKALRVCMGLYMSVKVSTASPSLEVKRSICDSIPVVYCWRIWT